MPPRFAYWTILIDDKPTAFRARDVEELLPTLNQLKRKNANVAMKWFSGGQLWSSPEAARDARRRPPPAAEKRGAAWRPGGRHEDPRDRFKKKSRERSTPEDGTRRDGDTRPPWRDKPSSPPGQRRWSGKPSGPPRGDRPWSGKPSGPPRGDRPWSGKPPGPPRGDRPWGGKPSGPPRGDRPWSGKPPGGAPPGGRQPWRKNSPGRHAGSDRAWTAKPGGQSRPSGEKQTAPPSRPWSDRPPKANRKPFPPRNGPPRSAPLSNERRRRDDEPPDRD
jgi:hypothetical protein